MNEYKLSTFETTGIMINLLCNKLFLLCPADFTKVSGSGAVICVLFVYALAFIFLSFYTKNNENTDILNRIKTPIIKKAFGVLSAVLLIFSGAVTLNLLVYFSKITVFLNSPLSYITVPFAVCMLFCAASGIKCIGKMHGFFTPLLYGSLVVLVVFSFNAFDFTNLTPIFGKGFTKIFGNGFFLLSNLFEALVFLYLPGHTKGSFKKAGFLSLTFSLMLYLVTISAFLLIGGKTPDLPLLSVIRSGAFRRTDSAFLLIYALSGMLYLSTLLYFSARIFADSFNIREKNALLIPFGLILVAFSGVSFFNQNGQKFLSHFSRWLWVVPFVLPLIITFFKEKRS